MHAQHQSHHAVSHMPATAALAKIVETDIPAMPQSMIEVSLLLSEEEPNLQEIARTISKDMALSAGIMRTLNSPLFALGGRVSTVQQAITYLGYREVASVTFQHSLKSVFPPSKQLDLIMSRATLRALIMGRTAQLLDLQDSWSAHSAGIFQECGKAVLLRNYGAQYSKLLEEYSHSDLALAQAEISLYGVSFEKVSTAMCQRWGLAAPACAAISAQLDAQAGGELSEDPATRAICALSLIAGDIMDLKPAEALAKAEYLSTHLGRSAPAVVRTVERLIEQVSAKAS